MVRQRFDSFTRPTVPWTATAQVWRPSLLIASVVCLPALLIAILVLDTGVWAAGALVLPTFLIWFLGGALRRWSARP